MPEPSERELNVFSVARRLSASERATYLDETCATEPDLRRRIEQLLGAGEEAGDFLREPAPGAQRPSEGAPANSGATVITPREKPGDRIDRYKLLQQIGEGGCGVVYMAEQEEPVRRTVALKVIKLGMDTKSVIARFEAERQALALMDHPNIAKVLDAGTTETGRPFFVMELVRGIKITDYCDKNNLPTRERLDLFVQVCQAVQHAHQKGIIHRDLKPSNILVTLRDGVPVPKVIDFGIAKATQQRLTDKTLFTAFEQFIGTPAYMSPEQAEMSELGIDTRSDIYSLGVLLYELLTGTTPFDSKALVQSGLDQMRRIIREQEPVRPSTRLTQELVAAEVSRRQSSTGLAIRSEAEVSADARRRLRLNEQIKLLRGDLDWIVMKALEKDRARRYETATGLAKDVENHLADEPVAARPPSKLYRLQKMARRNKLAFAAAAAVLLALVAGLAISTWFFIQEKAARRTAVAAQQEQTRSRQRAEASEEQLKAIHQFLTVDLLFQVTPERNAREKKVTMEEVLNVATSNLDHNEQIAQQPELEATLRLDIGWTYHKLGKLAEAKRNLKRAFDLRRSTLGPAHLDTLTAEDELADALQDLGHEYEEAKVLSREAFQGRQRLLGDEHTATVHSLEIYEITLYQTGHFEEAEQIARRILLIRERDHDALATIGALLNVAACVGLRGDHVEAERLCRDVLRRCQTAGTQRACFVALKELALHRLLLGDPEEADKLLTEAIPQMARAFGPEDYFTLHMQRVLARALAEEGQLPKAEALARTTLDARLRQGSDQEGTGRTLLILGRALAEQGKLDEAEPRLQQALTILRDHVGTKDAVAAQAANWLGAIQVARRAYTNAETLLLPGYDQMLSPAAQMSPNETRLAVSNIVRLYEAWDKPEKAAEWRRRLNQIAKP